MRSWIIAALALVACAPSPAPAQTSGGEAPSSAQNVANVPPRSPDDAAVVVAPGAFTPSPPPVEAPRVRATPQPVYPEAARAAGLADRVVLRVSVAADGTITGIQVLRGDPLFAEAAIDALTAVGFEPARDPDGNAVAGTATIALRFELGM